MASSDAVIDSLEAAVAEEFAEMPLS